MAVPGINSLSEKSSFEEVEKYVKNLFYGNKYTDKNSYSGNSTSLFSPIAIVNHLKNLAEEAGRNSKGLNFILSRAALHALNPQFGMGTIYNPASMFGPFPGTSGLTTNTFDPFSAGNNPGTTIAKEQDRLRAMYEGTFTKVKVKAGIPPVEIDGPHTRMADGTTYDQKMRELNIVGPKDNFNNLLAYESPNTDKQENYAKVDIAGVKILKPDYEKLFSKVKDGPGFTGHGKGYEFYKPNIQARAKPSAAYLRKQRALQNDDTFFTPLDAEFGYIDHDLDSIIDDDTYIPFYFQDFRRPERKIYFRAFLKSFSEKFTPDWQKEKFYGRVDPVPTYMGTERTVSVNFQIVAMSNVGLKTMWKKINNFMKLLYPTYNPDGVFHASPLGRMRIGDVICDLYGRGLPGYVVDATLTYDSYPWEIDAYQKGEFETGKVPMGCDLSITWQVIHEENPHVDLNYNINSRFMRRMGRLLEPQQYTVIDDIDPNLIGGDFEDEE